MSDNMCTISQGLKQLAETLESLDDRGVPVTDIATSADHLSLDEGLTAQFSVEIPLPITTSEDTEGSGFSATEAEVREDGSVLVSFEGEITDQSLETICVTEPLAVQSAGANRTIAPHRDPDALRDAYEQCDTFAEMKQALGTDVTPEAVRQQMVKHGIHEVSTTESSETEDELQLEQLEAESKSLPDVPEETPVQTETEAFASDGGFPSELTVEELKEIVKSSRTLYEATQQMRVDQDEARELLKQLNLLDLVTGRLSTRDEHTVTREEIDRRIRSSNLAQV